MRKFLSSSLIILILFNSAVGFADTDLNTNQSNSFNYYYQGQTLQQALQLYATANNLQLVIDHINQPNLSQKISGHFQVTTKQELLDTLANNYGFSWFVFNGKLYIANNKFISKSIPVAPEDMPSLKSNLTTQGLIDPRFGYSEIPTENKVLISGPMQYVDLLINQVKKLDIAPSAKQFAIFRLKYASATDITINLNNQYGIVNNTTNNQPVVTIPGVATILQALVNSTSSGNKNKQQILSQVSEPIKNSAQQIINNQQTSQTSVVTPPDIQADPSLNAIIIRDNAANIGMYRNLIKLLDVATPLVQVSVTILTIDQDALQSKGINWWASNSQYGGGYNPANASTNTQNLAFSYGQIAPGQVLVNTISNFTLAINFLTQNGISNVEAKPNLVTADNIPAVVSLNQNLFLSGVSASSSGSASTVTYQQAQVNTSLAITPHVIFDVSKRAIKLQINISDGSLTNTLDPNLPPNTPSTLQSNINSQAVINEGQSLLIAGYSKDENKTTEKKVPLLGDIPLLGYFFSWKSKQQRKLETIYIVTPKIVWTGINDSNEINNKDVPKTLRIDDTSK